MAAGDITFDSNNLQTFNGSVGIITQDIQHEALPTKDAKIYPLSHANRSAIPYNQYPSRTIVVSGQINGSSIADLDARVDAFKGYFIGTDKNLDIGYNAGTRRYIATVNSISVTRPGGLLYANFTITFICTQPFGQNTATTSALNQSGRTSSSYTDPYTFLGNAPFQLPMATMTYQLPLSGSTNLVTNPGFEVDTSGWAVTGAGGSISRVTAQFHSGVAALQVVNAAAATGGNFGGAWYSMSGLTPGQTYTLYVWAKGNVGGEIISLQPVAGAVQNLTLTTAWQQVAITFTAAFTTAAINVYSTNAASSTWFLDDVSVIANTTATVSWGNAGNGQAIYVSRTWAVGDVLAIDCLNKTVTVNGTAVAFTGAFPEFPPGAQNMSYNDTLASRTFSITVTYYPMFL